MRDDEVISGADVPPDALRCSREDGWGRCKLSKLSGRIHSEKHDQAKERLQVHENDDEEEEYEDEEEEDMEFGKKRRRYRENRCSCCSLEEEEKFQKKKKKKLTKKNNKKVSVIKETEEYHILDLLCWLKTAFPSKEFEMVEHIFKMREMKLRRKKKEAEKHMLQLMKELGVYETKFDKLLDELDEKKKQVIAAESKLEEFEFIRSLLEDEDCEYDTVCYQLKERVSHLEKGLENACQREKGSQQTIRELECAKAQLEMGLQHRNSELECAKAQLEMGLQHRNSELECAKAQQEMGLQRRICELECAKTRAENEIEFWKKMFKELETRVLVEPQTLRKISEEPRRVCSEISYAEVQKKNESRQTEFQSETNSALQVSVKEEAPNFDGRVCAQRNEDSLAKQSEVRELADEGKTSESSQTKIPNETSSALNGAWFSHMKSKDRALNSDEKIPSCGNVDFVSQPLAKESGLLHLSEKGKNSEMKIQNETSYALFGACSTPFKIKDEALNCDRRANAFDSIFRSLSKESGVSQLAVSEMVNKSNRTGSSYGDTSTVVTGSNYMEDEQNPVNTKILQLNFGVHCHSDSSNNEKFKESSPSKQRLVSV